MNKKIVLIVGILVAITAGVVFLALQPKEIAKSQADQPKTTTSTPAEEPSTAAPAPAAAPTPTPAPTAAPQPAGSYVDYSNGVIANTSGTKLLFFHAPWCPQCRSLEKDIKQTTLPSGVTIIKIDYDSSQALRKEYGVTLQTTFVRVDDNGKLVEKYVAYDNPTWAAVKDQLL